MQGQTGQAGRVTLVIPWLEDANDRLMLYGNTHGLEPNAVVPFVSSKEQEEYIRRWLAEEAGMPEEAKEIDML